MTGPPLFELVAYYTVAYAVIPIAVALLVARIRPYNLTVRKTIAVFLATIAALPFGYGATIIIVPMVPLSVLNLTIGPVVSSTFAAVIVLLFARFDILDTASVGTAST